MVVALSSSQVELNCRRIFRYGLSKLESDECGTLHKIPERSWLPFFYKSDPCTLNIDGKIPLSSKRVTDITPALIATLEGVCAEFTEQPPISFFMVPVSRTYWYLFSNWGMESHSYYELADRISKDPTFNGNQQVLDVLAKVKQLYISIDYKLDINLPDAELHELYRFIQNKAVLLTQSLIDTRKKKERVENLLEHMRHQLATGMVWDSHNQDFKTLEWVTSGDWR